MSLSNPLTGQGTLNRARASVLFSQNPELSITAPFLGPEGINLNLTGDIVDNIPTMTGTVTSPAIYQMAVCEVELLKTQLFADIYKQFIESLGLVGPFTIITDSPTLTTYPILNGSITQAGPGRMNGKSVQFMVTLTGYYLVNNLLFSSI
jgi:hypothetical protein